jgi:hypothetical protein
MNTTEWAVLSTVIENSWAGDWDGRKAGVYYDMLRSYDAVEVRDAIHSLVQLGQKWRPSVAEVVAAINAAYDVPIPAWRETWQVILTALGKRDEEMAREMLDDCHPLLPAFIDTCGWTELRQRPFFGEYGSIEQDRFRKEWEEFVDVARVRLRQGRAQDVIEGRAGRVRRLDASSTLLGLDPGNAPALPVGDDQREG